MDWKIMYWRDAIALGSFGIAWFVFGKALKIIADEQERLKLLK